MFPCESQFESKHHGFGMLRSFKINPSSISCSTHVNTLVDYFLSCILPAFWSDILWVLLVFKTLLCSFFMIRLIADKMRYLLSIQKHQSEGKYKSYNKPGLRKNLPLKSKSSLRYVEIVSRFGNRKPYFQFRFVVCFKWTSSLAGDKVKRLLN